VAFFSDIVGPARVAWAGFASGLRLGALGLVIALAASFGTQLWVRGDTPGEGPGEETPEGAAAAPQDRQQPVPIPVAEGRRFLEIQDAWESRLQEKATRALEAAFRGHVVVTVNLELDPRAETTSGVHLPKDGLQPNFIEIGGSERRQQEPRRESRSGAVPSDPDVAPAAAAFVSRLRRDSGPREFETRRTDPALYGRRTEILLAPVIRRITASVLIDKTVVVASAEPAATTKIVSEIVKHAIGFDETRGDRLHEPAVVEFAAATATAAVSEGDGSAANDAWLVALPLILFLFLVLILAWRHHSAASGPGPGPVPAAASPDMSTEQLAARMRHEIEKAIDSDPAAVSRALGDWAMEKPS
jgi:flagellar biosynthesis/type III secretory pathway M-ring protein FliF/YscJ